MADDIGVIYSNEEADQSFGAVLSSVEISSSQLTSLFSQSGNYLMFKIISDKLYILGDNRSVLYPQNESVDSNEEFAVYSKSKVIELLETGGENTTIIEQRYQVYSLTNGVYTLENSSWCPPMCN